MDGNQDFIFAEEPRKRDDTGKRKTSKQKGPVRRRQSLSQSAEAPYVDHIPHGVHDAARPEE